MEKIQKLKTSENLIKKCIKDLYINPKISIVKWSKITNQTAQGKFAYPAQHLASLITGIKGIGSAARGDDLSDGSEVKSCSRADQLNTCKDCYKKILIWQNECPNCGSKNITKDTSSHWIFPIKTDSELSLLLYKIPRIIFILFDKENLDLENIRIRAWSVENKEKHVKDFFTDYYENNFKKKISSGEKPAPCNLHPLKYDFLMMKPKLIFHGEIIDDKIKIIFWNIKKPKEQLMISQLLTKNELIKIFGKKVEKMDRKKIIETYPFIHQKYLNKLNIRIKKTKSYKNKYFRR